MGKQIGKQYAHSLEQRLLTRLSLATFLRTQYLTTTNNRLRSALLDQSNSHFAIPPMGSAALPPLIIIGMHRSGTTLLAELMEAAGVFMGWYLTHHHESLFFQELNRAIFALAHARWDQPAPISQIIQQPDICHALATQLAQEFTTKLTVRYLGWARYRKYRSLYQLGEWWGWKDPRTTFTLPIWLSIFPNAKVLHIYRNGVDVSHSLVVREQRIRQQRNALRRDLSVRCFHHDGAFDLWVEYLEKSATCMEQLPSHQGLEVSYEGLVQNPVKVLYQISQFLGITFSQDELAMLAASVETRRAYAFREDSQLCELYNRKKRHPMMQRYGYAELL